MRNVIFVAPFPMEATLRFARALGRLSNVRLLGVFQQPPPNGDGLFADVEVIADALDPVSIAAGCEALIRRYGPAHRVTGILEDIQVQLGEVRDHLGVPGLGAAAASRFRDKAQMKDALRAAGLPCARHRVLCSDEDAWSFSREVGFPLVLKPLAGAGCRSTWQIDGADALRSVLAETRPNPSRPVLAEEFLRGEEYTFETVCLSGQPVFHSICRYFPTPLEVTRTPWMQWCIHLPRDISGPLFDQARSLGFAAIRALGMGSGVTHMEWFRRPDGSLAIGEIAARPPGARIIALTSLSHDADLYMAWARATVDERFDGPWERRYSAGAAFLRGSGSGRVIRIDGLDEAQRLIGPMVMETKLPEIGTPKGGGYEGDGYAILRHPDSEVVKGALRTLIETVRIRYA